jgi:hypothetical protein
VLLELLGALLWLLLALVPDEEDERSRTIGGAICSDRGLLYPPAVLP